MSLEQAWTIAEDDMLCERYRACMQCGRPAARLDLRIIQDRAWAVSLCRGCLALDPDLHQIDARLRARAQEEAC
jgi:hypothetical protein